MSTREENSFMRQLRSNQDDSSSNNTLVVDVYYTGQSAKFDYYSHKEHVNNPSLYLKLAAIAKNLNTALQKHSYRWIAGGDGPVFGMHYSQSRDDKGRTAYIPHLRATCAYQNSLADEWQLIHWMIKQQQQSAIDLRDDIAVECWDSSDGQVLLIEAAQALPAWVDQHGPDYCRHACWLHQGRVKLIERVDRLVRPVSILEMIDCLGAGASSQVKAVVLPEIQSCIKRKLDYMTKHMFASQRTAIALPRPLADLLSTKDCNSNGFKKPDFVAPIINSLVDIQQDERLRTKASAAKNTSKHQPVDFSTDEWVWTTITTSRSAYAILRSIDVSTTAKLVTPQVRRLQRQGQCDTTPHLHYGVELGLRFVTAIMYILNQQCKSSSTTSTKDCVSGSSAESRVCQHWAAFLAKMSRLDSQTDQPLQNTWLSKAWADGPQHSSIDITDIINACPVYDSEVRDRFAPWTHPACTSMTTLLRDAIAKSRKDAQKRSTSYVLPHPSQVDTDDWMQFPDTDADLEVHARSNGTDMHKYETEKTSTDATDDTAVADDLFRTLETFTNQKSDVEGVETSNRSSTGKASGTVGPSKDDDNDDEDININPRVFLNLLHEVLRAPTAKDIRLDSVVENTTIKPDNDTYFLPEDYDGLDIESDDDDDDLDAVDEDMLASMDAVEAELREHAGLSLQSQYDDDFDSADIDHLQSIFMSLGASAGGPGPIQNILKEIGATVPDVVLDEESDD